MVAKFRLDAGYLDAATAYERIQLDAMTKIIMVKCAELRDLRAERARLAGQISYRAAARERRGMK